jgi:hypothetical protein
MPELKIPVELIEFVIYDLEGDNASLKSCALLCKSLLPLVRSLLFRRLEITPYTDYEAVVHTLTEAPWLANCVKHLTISEVNNRTWTDNKWSQRKSPYYFTHLFLGYFGPTSLDTLDLKLFEIDDRDHDGKSSSSNAMCHIVLIHSSELISILCAYPKRLHNLSKFVARIDLCEGQQCWKDTELWWIREVISNLPSTTTELHLHINAEGGDYSFDPRRLWHWNRIDWDGIDDIIVSRQFPSLKLVAINFALQFTTAGTKEWIEEELSALKLHRSKLLRVTFRKRASSETSCKSWLVVVHFDIPDEDVLGALNQTLADVVECYRRFSRRKIIPLLNQQ